jgi:hypothetical protein
MVKRNGLAGLYNYRDWATNQELRVDAADWEQIGPEKK